MTPIKKPRRRSAEEDLQKRVSAYLHATLAPTATFFAVPNGGYRNMTEAARMKATGTRPGVPDLIVFHAGRAIGIELKTKTGRLSAAQVSCHASFQRCGVRVVVCRSLDDVIAALWEAGVPMRPVRISA